MEPARATENVIGRREPDKSNLLSTKLSDYNTRVESSEKVDNLTNDVRVKYMKDETRNATPFTRFYRVTKKTTRSC